MTSALGRAARVGAVTAAAAGAAVLARTAGRAAVSRVERTRCATTQPWPYHASDRARALRGMGMARSRVPQHGVFL